MYSMSIKQNDTRHKPQGAHVVMYIYIDWGEINPTLRSLRTIMTTRIPTNKNMLLSAPETPDANPHIRPLTATFFHQSRCAPSPFIPETRPVIR